MVLANASPAGMNVLLSTPDKISMFVIKFSPSSKSKISSHHCFYITFKTKSEGIKIPSKFLKEYPDEMTIVLQNQYWNLKVEDQKFSVTLLFNKKKENLEVPFDSVVKFYDPFVKFSIQLELRREKRKKIDQKQNLKNSPKKNTVRKSNLASHSPLTAFFIVFEMSNNFKSKKT